MSAAFRTVRETARQLGVHHRTAAMIIAIRRVGEAMRLRGWV